MFVKHYSQFCENAKNPWLGAYALRSLILATVVTCLLSAHSNAGTIFNKDYGNANFFVNIECEDKHMAAYCEQIIKNALLRSSGFSVLDPQLVSKMKADEIIMARLNDKDPVILLEIEKKYAVDFYVHGILKVHASLLASQYQATASLTLDVIATKGAEVVAPVKSPEIGAADNPSPIRSLELPALQSAVTIATNGIIGQLCLPGGFEPENVVRLRIKNDGLIEHKLNQRAEAICIDGKNICYVGMDNSILGFNLLNKSEYRMNCRTKVSALAVWPDSTLLVSGHTDGSVGLWNISSKSLLWQTKSSNSRISALDICSNRGLIAVGGTDGYITVFNKKSSKPLWRWQAHKGKKKKTVHSLSFTYDGNFLFSGGSDRYICNWNIQNNPIQVSRKPVKKGLENKRVLGNLYAAAFTKEGNAAIVAFEDVTLPKFSRYRIDQNYLILYSIENGSLSSNPLYRNEQYRDDITSIALCPTTCRFLVSGAKDGTVHVTDLRTRAIVFKDNLQGAVQDVAFSPAANWLAAVSYKKGLFGTESILRAWQIE